MVTEDYKQNLTENFQIVLPVDQNVASTNLVDDEDSDEDYSKLDELIIKKEISFFIINFIMEQTGVTKRQALRAYIKNDENIVNAIVDLKMSNG